MNSDPTPANTVIPPATIAAKGYRVERRYEGDAQQRRSSAR